jgi:hypothetical protein
MRRAEAASEAKNLCLAGASFVKRNALPAFSPLDHPWRSPEKPFTAESYMRFLNQN